MPLNPTRGHLCIVSPLNLPAVDRSTSTVVLKTNGAAHCMRSLLDGSLRCHNAAYFICWKPGAAPLCSTAACGGLSSRTEGWNLCPSLSLPEELTSKLVNTAHVVCFCPNVCSIPSFPLVSRLFVASGKQQLLVCASGGRSPTSVHRLFRR